MGVIIGPVTKHYKDWMRSCRQEVKSFYFLSLVFLLKVSSTMWTLNETQLPFCLLCMRKKIDLGAINTTNKFFFMYAILYFACLFYTKKQCVDTVFIIRVLQSLGYRFYSLQPLKYTSLGKEDFVLPVPSQWGTSCTGKNTSATQW